MEHTNLTPIQKDEELSLKEVILNVLRWGRHVLQQWKLIVCFGLLGAGMGFVASYLSKPKYIADLSFVLEDTKSNPLSSYAGLASQIGIDLGSASGSGVFSGDNILEFLKSRLMIEKALLAPISINNKETSLADYYIKINKLGENWDKSPHLRSISFPINADRSKFSLQQDSILQKIYMNILTKELSVAKPDKKLSFVLVRCVSNDELFSKNFIERLVKEAIDFYVLTKTQRSKINVDKLQMKSDSIEKLLNRKTYSVAASQDLNLNPARNVAKVSTELASRDMVVLQTMYAEVIKNLEISKMSMAQETPIIQIVDKPILPLKREKFGKLKGLIIGGFLGGMLFILIITIRRSYKKIMA